MDHPGGCSRRHLDFGFVGVSALEGEYRDGNKKGLHGMKIDDKKHKLH